MEVPILEFRKNCIFDYTYFIATFFIGLDEEKSSIYADDARKFITNYLAIGEIDESIILSNYNKKNLKNLKNLSRNTLLKGDYFQISFAGGAPKRKQMSLSLNTTGISSYNNGPNSKKRTPNSNVPTRLSISSMGNSEGLFVGSNLRLNAYTNEFNNTNYVNFTDSTGAQSNMKVDNLINPVYFFKKISSKLPEQTKRSLMNECQIFEYLSRNNPYFLQNFTCFIRCYKNGILLGNGGSSLNAELKSRKFSFDERNIRNLLHFFDIVLELHKMLITHNDLKVHNIVGFSKNNVRIIDFGLAHHYSSEFYDINFFILINRVFKTIFFGLLKKYGFIS